MNVLSLTDVSVTLGDQPLFEQVTLGIDAGEKIGVVGRNGSGKSTFLRVLTGEVEPEHGTVARGRALSFATVEQRPVFAPGMRLGQFLFHGRDSVPAESAARIADVYRSSCRELGLDDPEATLDTFSGGMLRKASIARGLAFDAGFLLLDEPTNHLDLDTIEWLQARLAAAGFGFLLVTHDRYFLDEVCTAILEIEGRRIYKYEGNYSVYLDKKAERAEVAQKAEQRRVTVLRGELEWLKRGPRARTGKDKSRKARVADLQDAVVQKEMAMAEFSSSHRRLGKKILELSGVAKSWDGRQVLAPFTYSFRRGERIGIIGPNGSGKSTFLDIVAGRVAPDAGSAVKGETVAWGYLEQDGGAAPAAQAVIDFMKDHAERVRLGDGLSLTAEQFLERFLFPREMQGQALSRLSGGELRRLSLVRLLATAPNFLLLDEPTNDLDLDTMRLLEEYLADFPGCILLVSHDRALLDRLTDSLFIFDGRGGIRGFIGNYEEYRALVEEEKAAARPAAAPKPAARPAREKKATLSFKERQEYAGLLVEIESLEKEQKDLEAGFQSSSVDLAEVQRAHLRYREVERLLAEKLARWEELAARAGE
jgi:ABC transport system ATP-binding/permease protein